MKITWLGHSAFRIETGSSVILIDPFLRGNPKFRLDFDTVTAGTTTTTQRRLPNGQVVSGAIATAFATQKTDPCLAARGEVAVLVLRLSDRDAVLVVNGDLSGGPAHPAPPTQGELMGIIDSAELVG